MCAKWIWYNGDFEIYHHLLLSCRRQEHGCDYPCMWHISSPEKSVSFIKDFAAETDSVFRVCTYSKGMVRAFGKLWQVNTDIPVLKGEHRVEIEVYDIEAFPAIYIDSEYLVTDESWVADAHNKEWIPVSCKPYFTHPDDDPRVFPFEYKKLEAVSKEYVNGGVLYDFSKETFGPVTLLNRENAEGVSIVYGESRKEALDTENAIIRENLSKEDSLKRPARAFRYIFAKSNDGTDVDISAEYEYLPLEDISSFECDNPKIKKIWDLSSYTFHLNSREFFLDGIKRDRWVWSGDAYQSFMINRCLYNDPDITERTIIALLGKPPYKTHINTINDYSAYLIISVYEHWFATGNTEFVKNIYPNLKSLFDFIVSRLDENGLSVKRKGDWVFIDWGVLDKDGPHCVEQILLWEVYSVMTKLSEIAGENEDFSECAEKLKKTVNSLYWNDEKGAFIDTFESGKNFVSRQTNVFAVLFGFADEKQKESIIKNVFENKDLPEITTPYFKLYELLALCECGKIETAQNYILSYWGGMLDLGATSVWEAYDCTKSGDEHLEMYGNLYGKSLCHAWGSGPVLLLISKCAGVYPTSVGGKTFNVEPKPGIFKHFKAVAPVGNGKVTVIYDKNKISVSSTVPGGTLIFNGKSVEIKENEITELLIL